MVLATALFALMGAAHAYQTEVNAAYENTDLDDANSIDTFALSGKYYFNAVKNATAPLAEAGFLNRASNIALGYAHAGYDEDVLGVNVDIKLDSIGVAAEYYIPDTQFYVSAAVNHTKNEVKASGFGSEDESGTGYAAEVGFLPMTGWIAAIGVTDQEESVDPLQFAKLGFVSSYGSSEAAGEDTAVTLRTKYVGKVGSNDINLEAQALFGDETAYRVAGDFYFDPTLSVGISYADSSYENSDGVFGIRAQKFLTPVAAVGIGYSTTDGADAFGINGTFRF